MLRGEQLMRSCCRTQSRKAIHHAESIWPRGCRRFTDAGLAKTWWSETEELMGDDSLFWDYSDGDLFMAYGQTNSGVTRYEVYKVAYCLH